MMHRTLKRVALNFNWPLHKVWKGYINPYPQARTCKSCDGSGLNEATREIKETFYDHEGANSRRWRYDYGFGPDGTPATRPPWGIIGECRRWCDKITKEEVLALVQAGRLTDFTHRVVREKGWVQKTWETNGFWCPSCYTAVPQLSLEHHSGYCMACNVESMLLSGDDIRLQMPTAGEVNDWESRGGMGHDAINRWILIEARAKRLGVWGRCSECRGKGTGKLPQKLKKASSKWKPYEPPAGPGFQVWETTSEGSPISPVFKEAESLAAYCAVAVPIFANHYAPFGEWLQMIREEGSLEVGSMLVFEQRMPSPDEPPRD